jgi:hypothetical protein
MITYDVLVQEALDPYHDYLEADDRVARLNDILAKIGDKVEEAAAAGDADVAAPQDDSAEESSDVIVAIPEAT